MSTEFSIVTTKRVFRDSTRWDWQCTCGDRHWVIAPQAMAEKGEETFQRTVEIHLESHDADPSQVNAIPLRRRASPVFDVIG